MGSSQDRMAFSRQADLDELVRIFPSHALGSEQHPATTLHIPNNSPNLARSTIPEEQQRAAV